MLYSAQIHVDGLRKNIDCPVYLKITHFMENITFICKNCNYCYKS